ncbi:MAG: hypothetical protein ACK4OM_06065 [Alphaproteobacteria bacterium]
MNYRFIKIIAVTLLLSFTSCMGKSITIRKNPNFNPAEIYSRNIVILPTEATVHAIGFNWDKKQMHDYEYYIEDIINQAILMQLEKNNIRPALISNKNIHEKALSRQILALKENYKYNIDELYKSDLMNENKACSINNNIGKHNVILNGNNELWLLINYVANVKTNNAIARDFMIDALLGSKYSEDADVEKMIVALVDSRSGDILWSNIVKVKNDPLMNAFKKLSLTNEEIDRKKADYITEKVLRPLFNSKK